MFTSHRREQIMRLFVLMILSLFCSACVLPMPASNTLAPTIAAGIPDSMLTAAAATIISQLESVETPQPPLTNLPDFNATGADALENSSEQSTQATTVSELEAQETNSAAELAISTEIPSNASVTNVPMTMFPPASDTNQTLSLFEIQATSLLPCNGELVASFRIHNLADFPFESVSLQIQDVTTGAIILGSWLNNNPFVSYDFTCTPGGITKLLPAETLYINSSLGGSDLSGDKLSAIVKLCSMENLGGTCSQVSYEFSVP